MPSFLAALLALLAPILAILIVRVRKRTRLRFPHTYLRSWRQRPFREFLLRTFQLYSDVTFDLLLALLLALFLAGWLDLSPRRTAVCLDGSYSMTQGGADRPLDRAVRLLERGAVGAPRCRLFLLGFDPRRGRPALVSLGHYGSRYWKNVSPDVLTGRLQKAPRYFSADPGALARLFRRGYRRVIFITDRPPPAAAGLEVVDVGRASQGFFYPYAAAYDEKEAAFRVRILRARYAGPIGIMKFSDEAGAYRKLSIEEQGIPGGSLSELLLREPGLYRFYAAGEPGGLDFLLPLARPVLKVDPQGPYSELMADLLPGSERSPEGTLLADIPWRAEDRRLPAARGRHGLLTVILDPGRQPVVRPYLEPLADSFSLPCYTELPEELLGQGGARDRWFYFDPRGARDERTPLVYLSAAATLESAGLPPGARLSLLRSGTCSYAYTTRAGVRVLNLPPAEFFPVPVEPVRTEPAPATLPIVLLLALVYAGKVLFMAWIHRGAHAGTAAPSGRRRPGRG